MMQNVEIIPCTGEINNQFVGIKIINNKIEFHYPESYDLVSIDDTRQFRQDILSILRTISLAKTQSSSFSTLNSAYDKKNVFPLESYLWMINDYLTYGRYENREKKYVDGIQGRIDWKKTMRSNPAISNGNIIYTKIISEKRYQKDNIITEIYNCCVKKSIDDIGWIYGLVYDSNGINYDFLLSNNYKYYISVLNDEIAHTFDDNKKTRLINMLNVLTGLDDREIQTREMVYGVDSYDYVYERMIDELFSNVENIKDFYPSAKVDLVVESGPVNSSNLRPDTVITDKVNRKAYIIDAKYYRYGTTFNPAHIPETTSIQKQVTYGEYLRRMDEHGKKEYDEIYSAFIIPYSKTRNKYNHRFNKDIETVGLSYTTWYDLDGSKNRNVANILIDMKYLINNWIKKDKSSDINYLTKKIEEIVDGGVKHE